MKKEKEVKKSQMKDIIKLIVFVELITLFVGGCVHISYIIIGYSYPLTVYPFVMGLVLVVLLFVIFILYPLMEKYLF